MENTKSPSQSLFQSKSKFNINDILSEDYQNQLRQEGYNSYDDQDDLSLDQPEFTIVIPSRLKSTRLPEKPLRKIKDLELINSVLLTCLHTQANVIVATDSDEILTRVEAFLADFKTQLKNLLANPESSPGSESSESSETSESSTTSQIPGLTAIVSPADTSTTDSLSSTPDNSTTLGSDKLELARKLLDAAQRAQVLLTSSHHQNGTERLGEVLEKLQLPDDHLIVNCQGDEPFFNPAILTSLVKNFQVVSQENQQIVMGTIGEKIDAADVANPNNVKVVVDNSNNALLFSRSPIPYPRTQTTEQINYIKHAGVYVYSAGFIRAYQQMPMTPLAEIESLEQMKILENGYKIYLMQIKGKGFIGVDTQEDLDKAIALKTKFFPYLGDHWQIDYPDILEYAKFLEQFGEC